MGIAVRAPYAVSRPAALAGKRYRNEARTMAQETFTEEGKLREPERSMFTAAAQIACVFLVAIGAVIYLEVKNPQKDNNVLDVTIVGFALTWAGQLRSQEKAKEIQHLNQGQNRVLTRVADQVNGGTTAAIDAIKDQHAAEHAKLAEEFRVSRHDWNNRLHTLTVKLERVEAERDGLREQIAILTGQAVTNAETARTLAVEAKSLTARPEPPTDREV